MLYSIFSEGSSEFFSMVYDNLRDIHYWALLRGGRGMGYVYRFGGVSSVHIGIRRMGRQKPCNKARQGCVGSYGDGFRHYKNRKSRTEEFLYGFFIALVLIFLRTSYYTLKPLLRRLSISSPSISALVDETE